MFGKKARNILRKNISVILAILNFILQYIDTNKKRQPYGLPIMHSYLYIFQMQL